MVATYIPSYQVNKPSGRGIPNKERRPFLTFSEILKRGFLIFGGDFRALPWLDNMSYLTPTRPCIVWPTNLFNGIYNLKNTVTIKYRLIISDG
mgnify:CR=1